MTKCQYRNPLITAATDMELSQIAKISDYSTFVSGIGVLNCAINLQQHIYSKRPDFLVQVGICGALDRSLKLGEVVVVGSDFMADLGAWREKSSEFVSFDNEIFKGAELNLPFKMVTGRTVNTACTPLISVDNAQIESMEGAAFFAVAQGFGIPAVQIRAVSNYFDTPRGDWKIKLAIENLVTAIEKITFVNSFNVLTIK